MEDNLQLYIILFLAWIASTILIRAIAKTRATAHLPPGPRGLPVIGHLHLLGPSPHQSLHKLSSQYGPLFHLSLGSVPCVVISSPDTAKEFLRTQETSFSNRPQLSVLNHLSYPSADFTFAEYGPYWKLMKKLCMSRLLGGRTLDQLVHIRRDEIKRLLSLVLERASSRGKIEVRRELTRLTSNVISRMITSQRCAENEDEADEIRALVGESTDVLGEFNLSDYIWFCKRLDLQGLKKKSKTIHDKFDKMMERIIREHEKARNKENGKTSGENDFNDLLDILLDISEGHVESSDEIRLTKEHIKAFVLDVLVAGTDTSSITIEWALAELINHPNIMKKARQELDSIVGKTRLVEESNIPNLPYIQAIVKETLRLHPPGPILFREASENCIVLGGYEIPEKTRLLVNVWSIHRDPEHWENPLEFMPERFLNSQVDLRGQSFQFLAFGSGQRGCPGTSLGLQVVQTVLAAMVQCFDWKVDERDGIVGMEEGHGFTLPRANPLVCTPSARFSPIPL